MDWFTEDWRWVRYPASAWAAAALLHAADGGGGTAAASSDFYETHRLVAFLDVPKVGSGSVIGMLLMH